LGADEVVSQVAELLPGKAFAPQAELDHRHVGGVVADNQRRRDPGRQRLDQRLTDRSHFRLRSIHIRAGLEVNLDDTRAADRLRLDVLDIVNRGRHRPLDDCRNPILHLRRRKPAVGPDDTDDRNVDSWEDVRLHRDDRHDAQHGDEHCDHHKGVWAAKR
jgi:hypothetical protein